MRRSLYLHTMLERSSDKIRKVGGAGRTNKSRCKVIKIIIFQ